MKKIFLLLSIFTFYQNKGLTQLHLKENPLLTFMQNNFDTTFIFCTFSNWNISPNYFIIAKRRKELFLFTYISPYKQIGKYPDSLRDRFLAIESKFKLTEPDVNEYFLPKKSSDSAMNISWYEILKNGIWNLLSTDDSSPCIGKDGNKNFISDAAEEYFFLLTKERNKQVYFYAPEFFEEHCPGNINRINALKIMRIFNNLFKNDY